MNKTQREEWDKMIDRLRNSLDPYVIDIALITLANTHIMRLERELQALKNKKTMAALLMKKA
jgi:hypothetical protein